MKNKLVLGTVQFGLPYGINNAVGMPSDSALKKTLDCASKNGIHLLDTAFAYGASEERLGQNCLERFQFISKFPKVGSGEELRAHFQLSCERLQTDELYAYMAHNASFILAEPELWKELIQLQKEQKIGKIGVSLYQPEELDQLHSLGIVPEIVQIPYSLLDRKFESRFEVLKANGTEIHTRSAFLQGLYFMRPESIPSHLESLKTSLQELQSIVSKNELSMEAVALQFALGNEFIDRVVIGVDSAEQLEANLEFVSGERISALVFDRIRELKITDPAQLNPSTWLA